VIGKPIPVGKSPAGIGVNWLANTISLDRIYCWGRTWRICFKCSGNNDGR
jgi:hypothetical protein